MAQLKIASTSTDVDNIKVETLVNITPQRGVLDGTLVADWLMKLPPGTLLSTIEALNSMQCPALKAVMSKGTRS
jgi:hypothetical protein